MAVEAHQLLHIGAGAGAGAGGQKQLPHAGWAWAGDGATCYEAPASAQHPRRPCYYGGGRDVAAAAPAGRPVAMTQQQQQQQQQGFQFQQSSSCAGMGPSAPAPSAAAAPMVAGQYAAGQLCAADVASESGVTFGGGGGAAQQEAMPVPVAPRKRRRADTPVLGPDVAAHLQHHMLDVDRLVLQHTAKMWAELTEQRRRHARQVAAAAEAAAARRLRAKDDEIGRVGRLNWALEDRVRTLYVEAQVWRDLAQSNEAAAAALRAELKQTLDAQQQARGAHAAAADDAESGCCGDNGVAASGKDDGEVGTSSSAPARRGCAACGGAVEVVLLPCRHLCLCAPCAGDARACPACGCAKNGSICINFS